MTDVDKVASPDPEERRESWTPALPPPELSDADADAVLLRLRERAVYGQLANKLALAGREVEKAHFADAERVKDHLALVRALRQGGMITFAEYVVQAGSSLESIADHRVMIGTYDAELNPISEAMRKIEAAHGLTENQYWTLSEMPDDYRALSDIYDAVTEAKFAEVAEEFGENQLANMIRSDRPTYDALREEGRRSIFEKENKETALTTLILNYEDQARLATEARAYLAACLMWGAAAEAQLLLRCLQQPDAALAARNELGKGKPRREDPTSWTLEQLVLVTAQAGWLGTIEDEDFIFYVEGLIGQLRSMRNLVHPGRCITERPHLLVDAAMCDDARTAYLALRLADQKRLSSLASG